MSEVTHRIQLGRPREAKLPPRREKFLEDRLEVESARGVHGPDRTLLAALPAGIEGRVLVAGTREGVAALAIENLYPAAEPQAFFLDAFELAQARETLRRNGALRATCRLGADFPAGETFDWVVLAVSHAGDAMLTNELLREAHGVLKARGKILAAVDNGRDRWLHDRIVETFGSATIHRREKHGTVYIARKQASHAPRERDFSRQFEAQLFGQALRLESRPGVFSHGQLDDGTLALSEVAEITDSSRVIDIGCGSGAIGVAAALAAPKGFAILADSNARAAQSARGNASRNGAEGNTLVILSHELRSIRPDSLDVALANPPYYGDFRIAEHFARGALRVLKPGGKLWLVTKAPDQAGEVLHGLFGGVSGTERRGYVVLEATQRRK